MKTDWHPADVKAALEKAGVTLRSLSKTHGVSHSFASIALRKHNPRAELLIAKALGVTPDQIWPSRYQRDRCKQAA
jgi:Ner family transcriptional regulator